MSKVTPTKRHQPPRACKEDNKRTYSLVNEVLKSIQVFVLTLQDEVMNFVAASEKPFPRTYPGLQELDTRIHQIAATLPYDQPKYQHNKPFPFPKRYRQYLYTAAFRPAATILESLLESDDELSAEGRIVLRSALGYPRQLAAILLHRFYDPQLLPHLFDNETHIIDSYSKFGQLLSPSDLNPEYPLLKALWDRIQKEKDDIRRMAQHINDEKYWQHVTIHRVHDDQNHGNIIGKRIVLDPKRTAKYSKDKFYVMKSKDSYVVGSTSPDDSIQYHLFVLESCPLSDAQLKHRLSNRDGDEFVDEEWFVGAHVTNLDKIAQVKSWMNDAVPVLKESVKKLREIGRSQKRESKEVRQAGSKMYGTGVIADLRGNLGAVRNFPSNMPEGQKFDLMQANDYMLDGVVAVNSFDIIIPSDHRLPKLSFLFFQSIGRTKPISTMLYRQVSNTSQSQY
jgi:hypothetical protein